jgi:two-component system response regulator FixJ
MGNAVISASELHRTFAHQFIPVRMSKHGELILHGKVIALVDDDKAVCDSMQALLEVYDLDVRTYPNGSDFLDDNPNVACLIVDYHMPGLNGLELVLELQKRGIDLPTIMIAAVVDPAIDRGAAELGIRRVLRKPLTAPVLLAALRDVLM